MAYLNRRLAYSKRGEYHRGIEDYDEAIRLVPRAGVIYYYKGRAYGQIGEHEEALQDYAKAKELGYSP